MVKSQLTLQREKALKATPKIALVVGLILLGSFFYSVPRFPIVLSGLVAGLVLVPLFYFTWHKENSVWLALHFLVVFWLGTLPPRMVLDSVSFIETLQYQMILFVILFSAMFIARERFRRALQKRS